MRTLGVIGGSGLYDMPGLLKAREVRVKTPFGEPSDTFLVGQLGNVQLAFLPRHGRGHRLLPTEINSRANFWAFKKLGAERIISFSAVGSMREDIAPGHMVVVDQFIDRTRQRPQTFFGEGIAGHVQMADPLCHELAGVLFDAAVEAGATVHRGGTYLCIEGPQFSTRAESRLIRSWGVDVIGMTNLPEARLAREAELCYATVALSTDYDCWHQTEEDVTVEAVVAVMRKNVKTAQEIVRLAARRLDGEATCHCGRALKNAVMTAPDRVPLATWKRLELLVGRYLPRPGAARKRLSSSRKRRSG
ncbi:MAG: S-methyl-5'-thioadenosine phosphorylase [Deltaproteobacteria bacterium]|nr:S-methyl-5'-thioadenosine phosphorylase [Deltaproteobacteria bacterium]